MRFWFCDFRKYDGIKIIIDYVVPVAIAPAICAGAALTSAAAVPAAIYATSYDASSIFELTF